MSGDTAADGVDEIWDDWHDSVNMTAKELSDWLDTPQSKTVGDKSGGGEPTGHESGRRIVALLGSARETSARTTRRTCATWWLHPPAPGAATYR